MESDPTNRTIAMMDTLTIRTASPFKDIFPIRESVLNEIAESMKRNGYDYTRPIVIWAGHKVTVIDGHTRLAAALKAGISKVPIMLKEFADEEAALEYAINCQRRRRNLTDGEVLECLKALDERKTIGRPSKMTSTNVVPGRSAPRTAKLLGTSQTKVERMRTINAHAAPEVREALRDGKITVNRAYDETMRRRREEEARLPGYDAQKARAEKIRTFEKDFARLIDIRVARELREHPDFEYTDDEREGLIMRCLRKAEESLRRLPLKKAENTDNETVEEK